MRVHFLRQQGMSTRSIAKQLDISHSTVREDLKLVETHWSTIAAAAADDLLLESLQLLNYRLVLALENKAVSRNAQRLTPADYLRARDAHETQLTNLSREVRRTAQAVHQRAAQRPDQPELYESDDKEPQNLAKPTQNLPQPSTRIRRSPAQSRRSSKIRPPKKKFPPTQLRTPNPPIRTPSSRRS